MESKDESVKNSRSEVIGDEEKNTLEELVAPEREKEELNKNVTNEDILNEIKEAKAQIEIIL